LKQEAEHKYPFSEMLKCATKEDTLLDDECLPDGWINRDKIRCFVIRFCVEEKEKQ
jgi:hypothetical protein